MVECVRLEVLAEASVIRLLTIGVCFEAGHGSQERGE